MNFKITIENKADTRVATIDIEGVIGVPEEWQGTAEGAATYAKVREKIAEIERIDAEEVVVNIRSTGGDVNDALLMFEALRGLDKKVTTRCYGYTASAATIIAQAASEGCREISRNALYLIHESLTAAEGNARAIEEQREMLLATDARLAGIYAERSGLEAEHFRELMAENNGHGKWLSAEEAIAEGLADRIIATTKTKNNMTENKEKMGHFQKIMAVIAEVLGVDPSIEPAPATDPAVQNIELPTHRGGRLVVDIPDGEEIKVGDPCSAYITPEGESVSPDGFHALDDGREVIVADGKIEEIREPNGELVEAQARIAELESQLAEAQAQARTTEESEILALVNRVGGRAKIEAMHSTYHPQGRHFTPRKTEEPKSAAAIIAERHEALKAEIKK